MTDMNIDAVSLAERPDLVSEMNRISDTAWAEFLRHDPISNKLWGRLRTEFPGFQLVLLDAGGEGIAVANTIPLRWDGTVVGLPLGWDAALELGCRQADEGVVPNSLCALAAIVNKAHLGKGVSAGVLRAMRRNGAQHDLGDLIAPVRPTLKCYYPLTPIEHYIRWMRPDGRHFDPWIRVHQSLGAEILSIAPCAMFIPGTVAEWESWAGMAFPESGQYVVPGALNPIDVDREADQVVYVEPNVWMRHPAEE